VSGTAMEEREIDVDYPVDVKVESKFPTCGVKAASYSASPSLHQPEGKKPQHSYHSTSTATSNSGPVNHRIFQLKSDGRDAETGSEYHGKRMVKESNSWPLSLGRPVASSFHQTHDGRQEKGHPL